MKTCPNCNTFNPDKAVRCVSCSSPLQDEPSSIPDTAQSESFARSTFMGIPRGSSPGQPALPPSPKPPKARGTMMGLPAFQEALANRVPGMEASTDEETTPNEEPAPPPATRAASSGVSGAWARRSLPELTRRALSSEEQTFTKGTPQPFAHANQDKPRTDQDAARRTLFGFGRTSPESPKSGPMRTFSRSAPPSSPRFSQDSPSAQQPPSPRQTQFSFPAGPNDPNAGLGDIQVSRSESQPVRWNMRNDIRGKQTMPIPRLAFSEEDLSEEPSQAPSPSTRRARPLSLTISGPPQGEVPTTGSNPAPSQDAIFKLPRNPISSNATPGQGRQTMMGMRAVQPVTDATGEFQFNPDGFRFHGEQLTQQPTPETELQRPPGSVADDLDDFDDIDDANPLVSTMSGMRTFSQMESGLLDAQGLSDQHANEGLDDAIAMALEDVLAQSFDLSDDLEGFDSQTSDPDELLGGLPISTNAQPTPSTPDVSPNLTPKASPPTPQEGPAPLSGIVRPAKASLRAQPTPITASLDDPDATVDAVPSSSLFDQLQLDDLTGGWGDLPETNSPQDLDDLDDPFAPTQAVDIPLFNDPLFDNRPRPTPSVSEVLPEPEPLLLTDPVDPSLGLSAPLEPLVVQTPEPAPTPSISKPDPTPQVQLPQPSPISPSPQPSPASQPTPAPQPVQPSSVGASSVGATSPPTSSPTPVVPPVAPPPPVEPSPQALVPHQSQAPVPWYRSCLARVGMGIVLGLTGSGAVLAWALGSL